MYVGVHCAVPLLAIQLAGRLVKDQQGVGGKQGEALRAEPVVC